MYEFIDYAMLELPKRPSRRARFAFANLCGRDLRGLRLKPDSLNCASVDSETKVDDETERLAILVHRSPLSAEAICQLPKIAAEQRLQLDWVLRHDLPMIFLRQRPLLRTFELQISAGTRLSADGIVKDLFRSKATRWESLWELSDGFSEADLHGAVGQFKSWAAKNL